MPGELSWLEDYSEAFCVTFARGLDEKEMLRRFGADLSMAQVIREGDWKSLDELRLFGDVVQAGQSDGWAFIYECNGYAGTLEEILRPISAGTVVVSVFRNVNAHTCFCYAEDGTIIANFDPLIPPFDDPSPQVQKLLRQAGITPESVEDEEEDYDFVGAMFALAQAVGVRLERETLEGKPLLSAFLRNPVADFLGDLFTQGGDEQTVNRLLALLAYPSHRAHLFDLMSRWQQPECPEAVAKRVDRVLEVLLPMQAGKALLEVLKEEQSVDSPKWDAMTATRRRWRQYDGSRKMAVTEMLKALIRFDQMHDRPGTRERLLTLATAPQPEVVRLAALALGTLGDQRAAGPLVRVLSFYPHEKEAVQLLGQMHAKEAIEPLLSLLDPQDEEIGFQRTVLETLVQIGEERVAEQLLPLLHPESQWALREAQEQMVQEHMQKTQQMTQEHTQQAQRTEQPVRTFGFVSIAPKGSGDASHQQLIRRMHAHAFQKDLLASLGQLGNPRVVEPLLNLLTPHPRFGYSGDLYVSLLEALGELGDTRAIEPLARLLNPDIQFREWHFQQALVRALRQLGDTRAELQMVERSLQRYEEDYHEKTGRWLGGKPPSNEGH
ncbi:MAG TPA: DUF6461 domain-containing protein [Ktedonobacteraceae bacterium]|nr:DUF6461 domain-containing protein [Ktedonobacteraceae bacterium]